MQRQLHYQTGMPGDRVRRLACATVCATILIFAASQALARSDGQRRADEVGGYSGPGPAIVTVDQLKGMRDDAKVTLKGTIIQSLGGKQYLFKDATGTVTLEINDSRWQGQKVGPDDIVEIQGELDKDWAKMEVEVKRLIKR